MRNRTAWRQRLIKQLNQVWQPTPGGMTPGLLLDVELGLHLLVALRPGEPAQAAYELLAGYPLLHALGCPPGRAEEERLAVARHLLAPLRTRRDWSAAIQDYRQVPEHVRGFLLGTDDDVPWRRDPSVAPDRFTVFDQALGQPPRLRRERLRVAGPGRYLVNQKSRMVSVDIPEDLPLSTTPRGHDTTPRTDRQPTKVSRAELEQTAAWMDQREREEGLPAEQRGEWTGRLKRMHLELRDQPTGRFTRRDQMVIDGVLHLIGMVSSGKSTLMVLLAVCAAQRGQRVTVVVGDVIAALRLVATLRRIGVRADAAPVVGASTQRRHIDRLHRIHATAPHDGSPLASFEDATSLLSTACALDALRPTSQPWEFRDAPCRHRLLQPVVGSGGEPSYEAFGCPLWACCQRHQASRDVVDAGIWVATPASLVYSRVPQELNPEQLRYLELVWRRSDLVVVDEADQVQAQLDAMFSPGQTLIGHGTDAWLELLMDHTETELRGQGRAQFDDRPVREWSSLVDTARTVTNRLYALLKRHPLPRGRSTMREWIGRDCFTEWTLADKLVRAWSGNPTDLGDHPTYRLLREAFDTFLPDPLGLQGRGNGGQLADQLVSLARELVNMADETRRAQRVSAWITALDLDGDDPTDAQTLVLAGAPLAEHALRLEFTLLLAVLSNTLNALIRGWRTVEVSLNLDAASGMVFQRPPDDYSPVVPAPPMGSVLGYQYHESDRPGEMGQLRFFRCAGIGRWVLLHLHELFRPDSSRGPNVLLMSGTSWAGTSPRYDVQVPVEGILRAPDEELDAIKRSTFLLTTVDHQDEPIAISGLQGARRNTALRWMLEALASKPRPDRPSLLERERDRLASDRRRLLLVVGSYAEAKRAAEDLVDIRPDWSGKVLHLVADEADFSSQWSPTLRRGDVARFAGTGAWVLIAPLLAIERGHNILTDTGRAAIGSAYFLVRPHPRPDDISYPVQAMNRWAIEQIRHMHHGGNPYNGTSRLGELGRAFRSDAYRRWQRMLTVPLIYSTLGEQDRTALAWTQLVTIWQVIGRLVRGGCEARVHFCDAKFAPAAASRQQERDDASDSLLVGMYEALHAYLGVAGANAEDRELVDALYGPLYQALQTIPGVANATI